MSKLVQEALKKINTDSEALFASIGLEVLGRIKRGKRLLNRHAQN